MKLMEKLKNALFEEEYVEVVEKPKPKKQKPKEKVKNERPIAQKIAVAEKIEKPSPKLREPQEEREEEKEYLNPNQEFRFPIMSEEDFSITQPLNVVEEKEYVEQSSYIKEPQEVPKVEERPLYQASKEKTYDYYEKKEHSTAYEKKPERGGFKPSPIISPIYGVLDKNYRKEEVREKKEVRISSFSKEELDLDAVRKKAYGDLTDDLQDLPPKKDTLEKQLETEEDTLLVDLSSKDTPTVNKVTVGDAEEYFEDLGLEYNNDYIDGSKEKASGKKVKEPKEENIEKIEEKNDTSIEEDNDNLFDLIDSMYNEE